MLFLKGLTQMQRLANGESMSMEAESIRVLYFSLQADISAKAHRWSKVKLPLVEIGIGKEGKMLCCSVPEYYVGNRKWEEERLADCLSKLINHVHCEEYYLQPELARMVGVREKLPPEILLYHLLRQIPCMEYLCCIGWEEEQALLQELLAPYFSRINHVNVISDSPQAYEEFTEYIYEEYGIPTSNAPRLSKKSGRDGRTVILDGKKDDRIPWSAFPTGSVYVDFWSGEEKKKLLEKFRRDVRYLSVVKFLDTTVKNGYNTIVN